MVKFLRARPERGKILKISNFFQERTKVVNMGTKICRIITLVGVETIFESLSRSSHEISTTPCFFPAPAGKFVTLLRNGLEP